MRDSREHHVQRLPCKTHSRHERHLPGHVSGCPEAATGIPAKAAESLAAGLSFYVESGRAIPSPSVPKRGQILIHPAAGTVAKLALYQAMKALGISQVGLARRLGVPRQQAARIVDPAHNTKFEVLEAALAAVGKRLAVVIDDAA